MKQFLKKMFATAIGMFFGTVLSFLILPILIIAIFKAMHGGVEPIEDKSVLHLFLHGRLVEKARPLDFDLFSRMPLSEDERGIGLYELTTALNLAKKDPRIQGVFLELGDLDAGWASATTLREAILDLTKSGKFVYSYGERFDERTYFLARAAQQVYLQPNGEIEFNGLAVSEAFLKGLFQKLEIEPRIFRVGKFKAAVEPLLLEKMSEENRLQNQMLVNDIWNATLPAFRKPGKLEDQDLNRIASQLEVNSADEAEAAGFVDELAYRDEVMDMLAEKTVGADEEVRFVTPGQLLRGSQHLRPHASDKIAVLFADGEIVAGSGDFQKIGSDSFVEDLEEARSDKDVKAIVIRINSPGGDALASDVIWRELARTDQEIPVIASMGDVAASGGYYIAAGARHIFAEASTITGSIGVFGVMFDSQRFFRNKLGVNFDRVVTHPYADIGDSNRAMTEFEKKKIQESVERVYGRFISVVRERRKLPETQDPATFAEGRVWSGTSALQHHLVDQIGGLADAVQKAAEIAKIKKYHLDIYPRQEEPFRRLLELISGETIEAMFKGTMMQDVKATVLSPAPMKAGVYARMPFDLRIK